LNIGMILAFGGGLLLLYLIGLIFSIPLKIIWKLIINGVIGFVLLMIANWIGEAVFDFTIAVNPLNSLVAGVFGIPGVILLIVLTLIL